VTGTKQPAIEVADLVMSFGSMPILEGVSFAVEPGECFGLLGPNGAGKSTLIKIIYGALAPTRGRVRVFGHDPGRDYRIVRRSLGVVMQDDALDEAMTVRDNMLMFCGFFAIGRAEARARVDRLLDEFSLSARAHAKISSLSGGMRRRLSFVRSLLADPRLLILDEPTRGFDPGVRHTLWDVIRSLRRRGTTILLITHHMAEAELLCDHLVLLAEGRVKAQGAPLALIHEHCPGFVALHGSREGDAGRRQLYPTLEALVEATRSSPPDVIRPSNLEDVFLTLTGQ
jgi:lipooligosaccharide transport system ATP-binding protein